ncbi:MAG: hydrogenase maturation protease [Vulcanimicrobiaceae bacterium]
MSARVLVAGVGNIFFGDDGFGSAVVQRLAAEPIAAARVEDFGIRGVHLAFEMLAAYDRVIVIDAVARGEAAGTLYVIEPDPAEPGPAPDAHRMDLQNVFAFLRTLGGEAPPVEIVGCEPQSVDDGIGLSQPVAAAIEPAAALVRELVARALAAAPRRQGETTWLEA